MCDRGIRQHVLQSGDANVCDPGIPDMKTLQAGQGLHVFQPVVSDIGAIEVEYS